MSKEKRRVPKLRFPGFTEDWEQRKLGSIGSTYTGLSGKTKEDFGHGEAQYITYLNVFQNTVSDITMTDKVDIDTTQNEVKYGDVLFTTSSETPEEVGMSSVWLGHMPNIYLNSFCFGFRPNQKIDPYFLGYSLRAPYMRDKMKILAQGISRYNISKNKVMELEISLPNNEEQRLLGNFLRNIDLSITLHQRKLEHLNLKKKALLQKLFPKNGERYPELRFPGFTDAWEQRKLLTVLNKIVDYRGRTPKKLGLDWSPTGHLALSALNVKMGYIDKTVDAHYGDDHLYSVWMKDNDLYEGQVLFTTEAPMGNVAQVPDDNKYILSQRTIAFVPDRSVISDNFLAVVLSASKCQKSLTNRASGGTAKGVSQKTLSEISLDIPKSLSEQDKVSELIKKLSKVITLHQRKLDHLQLQKKALLQQMFV